LNSIVVYPPQGGTIMQENHRQRLLEILDTCVVQMRTDDGNGAPLLAQCPDENEYASRLA